MIGVGIALVVIGLIFLFIVPWVGIPVGIVGVVLAILWIAGIGRGLLTRRREPAQPHV